MTDDTGKVLRPVGREWLPIKDMKVSPQAQRSLQAAWVATLASEFKPDALGVITVNKRGGLVYVVDGMHRVHALRQLGGDDQLVECDVYSELSLRQEADLFLELNHRLRVDTMATFQIGVVAERPTQVAVQDIVQGQGLVVSKDTMRGAIRAVGTLESIYKNGGARTLTRTLRLAHGSFGDSGLGANVLGGVGLVCQRYNGELDDEETLTLLRELPGGVGAVTSLASLKREQTGRPTKQCVAAAIIDLLNKRRRKKLPKWFKEK